MEENECTYSLGACFGLTIFYVGSLYIWKNSKDRDHPSIIKRRFFSVCCVMILAPLILEYFLTENSLKTATKWEIMGVKWTGLLQAIVFPWLLTMFLFLGPLTMNFFAGYWQYYLETSYWLECFQDLVWLRNHLMAPISEEWVFRACIVPLLCQCVTPMQAVFYGPLFFGIAHFHHVLEQTKAGVPFFTALAISTFQFMYTSIFGAYSAYLFVRTGHIAAPLAAHIFCNHMGFPNFGAISEFPPIQRGVIIINFILGAVIWALLLDIGTDPQIYDNSLYKT